MLVGAIKHKSDEGAEEYMSKLEEGIEFCYNLNLVPDIVVGPDYALSRRHGGDIEAPNDPKERQEILKKIKRISKEYPKTRIIPGTMFWHDNMNAYHSTPMYSSGNMIDEFFKKRSNGESEAAEKLSLSYKRGDNSKSHFFKDGKKISVEICGDHGTQDAADVDLQLILAYDNKAGFYVTVNNDRSSRLGMVCNGYDGETKMNRYDAKNGMIIEKTPMISNDKIDLYDIMENENI